MAGKNGHSAKRKGGGFIKLFLLNSLYLVYTNSKINLKSRYMNLKASTSKPMFINNQFKEQSYCVLLAIFCLPINIEVIYYIL